MQLREKTEDHEMTSKTDAYGDMWTMTQSTIFYNMYVFANLAVMQTRTQISVQ